jgi:hypothetical protein
MTKRERLSATVDADVLEVANAAVVSGRAESVSAWVNEAMHRQAEHDARMTALDEFIGAYEAEHGEITEAEMLEATRSTRARAIVVRPKAKRSSASGRGTTAERRGAGTSGVA